MGGQKITIADLHHSGCLPTIIDYLSQIEIEFTVTDPSASGTMTAADRPDLLLVLIDYPAYREAPEILAGLKQNFPGIPFIGIVDGLPEDRSCELLQGNLWVLLTVPVHLAELRFLIEKLRPNPAPAPSTAPSSGLKARTGFRLLRGQSPAMCYIKERVAGIAPYDVNVMIRGETGTGKELVARMIHYLGKRSKKPFIAVNCGAIPAELFENELFGHKKGAYTHADQHKDGLIAAAEGGILFLDEVESLPASTQVKLLRFLQEKKYRPLGATSDIPADVQIISAAKQRLWESLDKGTFRQDLLYRLNVVQICLPVLRERREDIPELANFFIDRYCTLYQKSVSSINEPALKKLSEYDWPGNVRELENVIQEAVITTASPCIEDWHLDLDKFKGDGGFATATEVSSAEGSLKAARKKVVESFEKSFLIDLLKKFKGNVTRAAASAKKDRRSFNRLLRKYNIDPANFRIK